MSNSDVLVVDKIEPVREIPEAEVSVPVGSGEKRRPVFTRMRLDWNSEDRRTMKGVKDAIDGVVARKFRDVYTLLYDIYSVVRIPLTDERGEPLLDPFGYPQWKKSEITGTYIEDYTKLTNTQAQQFVHFTTVHLFDWEQMASDIYGEALFAKAAWEEKFALGFDAPLAGTVDDRTAAGKLAAAEERYFAIYLAYLSHKVENLIKSVERINLRLSQYLGH